MPNRKASRSHLSSVPQQKPEPETKRNRFERIGKQRMQRALTAIRLIGNLSVPTSYEFNSKDVATIEEVLRIAVDKSMARFRVKTATNVDQFFFPANTGSED